MSNILTILTILIEAIIHSKFHWPKFILSLTGILINKFEHILMY